MSKLDRLYQNSPVWLQNSLVSAYGLYWHWARFGGNYTHYEEGFRNREANNLAEWHKYCEGQLIDLLAVCRQSVPYYRETWSATEHAAAAQGRLNELPLLEKEVLRNDPKTFIQNEIKPFPKFKFYTSGTTGTPISCIYTLSELRNSMAVREIRSAGWAGVSFKQPRATFSGRMVEPNPNEESAVYRYNAVEKQVYFSAFHLKPDTAVKYVEALKKHNIVWMTGYAVSFYLLAKFILDQSLNVPPLKAVITTSEKLTPEMRQVMEKAYHCRIYEEYSTVENALFVSECEHGRLHVSPDVGIVEILTPDRDACLPGEVGEVVTTCLLRSYQPLIRFRLGDLAAWDSEPCPCGRSLPVIKEVVGRIEDVVTGPDGRQLVRFHGIFVDQPNIFEGQIIQETLSEFTVKVVPTARFSEIDIQEIKSRMHQRLGESVNIRVEQVERIPRTSSGKFQAVISRLKE